MKIGDRIDLLVEETIKLLADVPQTGYMGFDKDNRLIDIKSAAFYESAIPVLELGLRFNNNPEHRYQLGVAQSNLAESLNKEDQKPEKQAELLEKAIENFRACIDKDDEIIPDHHYQLGRAYFDLSEIEEDFGNREDQLANALLHLRTAYDTSGVNTSYLHFLARTLYSLADESHDVEQRRSLVEEAKDYFEKLVEEDGDASDYFWLGEVLSNIAEETADYHEKKELFERAMENLQRSYDMDRDKDTLKKIEQVQEDMGLLQG